MSDGFVGRRDEDAPMEPGQLLAQLERLTPPRPAERDEATAELLDRLDAARRRAVGEDHEQLRLT